MLTARYKKALRALQSQAVAALDMLKKYPIKDSSDRGRLKSAHLDMSGVRKEVSHIVEVVMGSNCEVTVPTISEEELEVLLIKAGYLIRRCRVCGCTDYNCSQCVAKTGHPCYWVELDLCSACAGDRKSFTGIKAKQQL